MCAPLGRDRVRLGPEHAGVGATRRQLIGMACWQIVTVALIGMLAGVAAGGSALIAVTRALTGSWHPYIPTAPALGFGAAIVGLTAAAVLGPTAAVLRTRRQERQRRPRNERNRSDGRRHAHSPRGTHADRSSDSADQARLM